MSESKPNKRRLSWSPERRAAQSAMIHQWAPWRRSTGPTTPEGKKIVSNNWQTNEKKERIRAKKKALALIIDAEQFIRECSQ